MKIQKLIEQKNLWTKIYPFIITILFLTLSIFLIYNHELWFDEIQAWHIGSEAGSIQELINTMRADEGHPCLWFYILYLISHFITKNPESIKIIHLAISTVSVFLILKHAPFNKIIKAMMVFGYFFFYEYSIIPRNYALGILLMIIFCILYKNKYKNLILLSITLFFMGQVSIFSFIISVALSLFLLFELIRDWKYIREDISKIYLTVSIFVVVMGFLFIYWQLGSQIGSYSDSSVFSIFLNPISGYLGGVFSISRGIIGAYIPVPNFNLNFINSNFLVDTAFNRSFLPTFLLSLILFLIPVFIIKKRLILLYLTASIGIMFIPFYIYKCSIRHFGHFFIIFIICLWLSNIDRDHGYLIRKKNFFFKKFQIIFLIVILSISIIGSGVAFYYDYKYPFSNGKNVARYIEENFDKEEIVIIGYQDYAAGTIAAYLDKDIYCPQSKSFQRLVKWPERIGEMQLSEVFNDAGKFTRNNDTVLVVISNKPVDNPEIYEKHNFKKVDKEFDNGIFYLENSYLYLFDKEVIINNSELLQKIDYSNFGEYWLALSQCEFIVENKKVLLKINGDDPWFESRFPIEFKDNFSLLLRISLETPVSGEIRIFYDRGYEEYIWEDSTGYPLVEGQNKIIISIPYSEDLDKIRIDPIDKNQDCLIEKIELYSIEE